MLLITTAYLQLLPHYMKGNRGSSMRFRCGRKQWPKADNTCCCTPAVYDCRISTTHQDTAVSDAWSPNEREIGFYRSYLSERNVSEPKEINSIQFVQTKRQLVSKNSERETCVNIFTQLHSLIHSLSLTHSRSLTQLLTVDHPRTLTHAHTQRHTPRYAMKTGERGEAKTLYLADWTSSC